MINENDANLNNILCRSRILCISQYDSCKNISLKSVLGKDFNKVESCEVVLLQVC